MSFTNEQYQNFVNMFQLTDTYINNQNTTVMRYNYIGNLDTDALCTLLNINNMPYRNEMLEKFYNEYKIEQPINVIMQFIHGVVLGGILLQDNSYQIDFLKCDSKHYRAK